MKKKLVLLSCLFALLFVFAFLPPLRAGRNIQAALRNPPRAEDYLGRAEKADPLSPRLPLIFGQAAVQKYHSRLTPDPELLLSAAGHFQRSAEKNPADYRVRQTLSDTWLLLAEQTEQPERKTEYLLKARRAAFEAWLRFPGSDQLTYQLGQLAEQLGQDQEAVTWYRLAVDIEDAYRIQFRQMYPEYDLFSRLGEQRYTYAEEFIEARAAGTAP